MLSASPSRRVKEHCIQRGFSWNDSLASTSCAEAEYYEDLLRFYRYNYRVRGGAVCCRLRVVEPQSMLAPCRKLASAVHRS